MGRSQLILINFRDDFDDDTDKVQPRNKRRVRIAILDSGINTNIEKICNNKRFVKKYCPFKKYAAEENRDDHGTHLATLSHKAAPSADIYTARVIIDDEKTQGKTQGKTQKAPDDPQDVNSPPKRISIIAETIKKAAEDWEVNIIVTSFCFPHFQDKISHALADATRRCLVFAAAPNDGANPKEQIAFPASHSRVFCVYSTDGNGNHTGYDPNFQDDGSSLSTLEENAMSISSGGKMVSMSVTSVAALIAAMTAALIIEFTRQKVLKGQSKAKKAEFLETRPGRL